MGMTSRLKLMHEFVRYIYDYGMTELLHEDLAAKEKRRCRAKAKRRAASRANLQLGALR